MTALDRFMRHVIIREDGCHEWTGTVSRVGYGLFKLGGKNVGAHRQALEFAGIWVPGGMVVHHTCYNRRCVNVSHLELITNRENLLEERSQSPSGVNARKITCDRGHPLSGSNLYMHPTGRRRCRECAKRHAAEHARRAA